MNQPANHIDRVSFHALAASRRALHDPATMQTFARWKDVFDCFPIADSPGYHTFRHWYRWNPVTPEKHLGLPAWKISDLREGRTDPYEEMV